MPVLKQTKSIAIIGAGMLGMTLALRLAEAGFKVTLIEASDHIGGLAAPCKIGPYTWDRFYHVILMSDTKLLALIDQLGLKDEIVWGETKTGFYTDSHLYSMSNTLEFLTFPPLNLLDKFRLGATIFYVAKIKNWPRLEQVLVADWLKHLAGERTFNKVWLPLLKSKLGENYKITSASFIWATISRMYAARRSGLKKEMFGYVKGGYATILNRFQELLDNMKIQTLCDTSVSTTTNNGLDVKVDVPAGKSVKFDAVVLTTPCNQIPALCPQLATSEQERLRSVIYQGTLCATLITKKPLGKYYITNITDDWVPFTGIIEMTALVDNDYFDGNSLIYLPRYLTKNDPFWEKDNDEIKSEFLMALESMYPKFKRDDVLFFKLSKAEQVLPLTTLNYSKLLPATNTSLENVFVVNSSQIPNGTMNVNEIVGLANRKASEIADLLRIRY